MEDVRSFVGGPFFLFIFFSLGSFFLFVCLLVGWCLLLEKEIDRTHRHFFLCRQV